jgi:hypothetical protein
LKSTTNTSLQKNNLLLPFYKELPKLIKLLLHPHNLQLEQQHSQKLMVELLKLIKLLFKNLNQQL